MGNMEAIADAMTGTVLAGAVEPAAGEDGHTHEQACLNCGAALLGSHCHRCGQAAHVHRTLSAFFHDLLHGVFHFEGKIWRTLPLLAWKPGELTRRYIDGQRASFVSPIALFLFCVFLMFAVVSSLGPIVSNERFQQSFQRGVAESQKKIAELTAERARLVAAHQSTADVDRKIASERDDLEMTRTINDKGVIMGSAERVSDDVPASIREPIRHAAENPALFFYKLKSSAYKYSWALIPLSVPFLWLLFPFSRRYRLYDHTVFVTYSLCFMSLLATVATIWSKIGLPGTSIAFFVPPFHIYRQLRGTYALGPLGALWRTGVLLFVALTAVILFVTVLVGLGLFD